MTNDNTWPTGAVTFLFTDIEDSTPLWDRHHTAMRTALALHDDLLQTAVESNGGVIVKTTGDGLHAAFASPSDALSAALESQRALQDTDWSTIQPDALRVRMGLHTGEAELRAGDYYGTPVNRAARLMSIGHGGQILLSSTTSNLIGRALPAGIRLLDLGRHRLKGLSRPAHVFQVEADGLAHEFQPLQTGEMRKGNLPQLLTSFVGREQELAKIRQLLHDTRLLTLTGPGGTGKTRLSLEAGHQLEETYDHGVWLAELAPLTDKKLVGATIASLFELLEQPGTDIKDTLADYLRSKKLLLILDNCEHLVAACAELAAELLPVAPRLTIMASSREGLGVPGETTVHVPALGIPGPDIVDHDALARFEGVRLFVARARAARPGFELTADNAEAVGQIVRRLDGIPLAIELAAARVKLMSPSQIAGRLDDRFRLLTGGSRTALPRQQTLRALIDWSYDLLDEDERWFLRQMAVFSGGWTLEAAEYVVDRDLRGLPKTSEVSDQLDALDLLANLVNKSLVRIDDSGDEVRYRYLETIRQYARDKLVDTSEGTAARKCHFAYFLTMATEEYSDGLIGIGLHGQLAHLEAELDNIRAALAWGVGHDAVTAANLLYYSVDLFFSLGLNQEGQRTAEGILEALAEIPPAEGDELVRRRLARAFALTAYAAGIGTTRGDAGGYAAVKEAVSLLRTAGAKPEILATTLLLQGIISAGVAPQEGYEAAREGVDLGRAGNNQALLKAGLVHMARLALIKDDLTAMADHLAAARQIETGVNFPFLIVQQAFIESLFYRSMGDFEAARRALEAGVTALQKTHHRYFANMLESETGHVLRQSGNLEEAEAVYCRTILEWHDLGHRAAIANQLEDFGFLAISHHQYDRAARLLGAAEALRESIDSHMDPQEQDEYDVYVATLRETLDAAALEDNWQEGRRLELDAAVDYALTLS